MQAKEVNGRRVIREGIRTYGVDEDMFKDREWDGEIEYDPTCET